MSFSDSDYREILFHLRNTFEHYGLSDIGERGYSYALEQDRPRDAVVVYLNEGIKGISERSRLSYDRALGLAQEYVHPRSGGQITGIQVTLSERERELFQLQEINLAEAPDLSEFLSELTEIVEEIKNDEPDEWEL